MVICAEKVHALLDLLAAQPHLRGDDLSSALE